MVAFRLVAFAVIVVILASIYNFLAKFSIFRFLGRMIKYTIIVIFNLIFIVAFMFFLMYITNLVIILFSMTELFDSKEIYEIGIGEISQSFVITITILFIVGTMILSLIPLSNRHFRGSTLLIVLGGTTISLPFIIQKFYESTSVSFLLSFSLSIIAPLIMYIAFFIMKGDEFRRERKYIWKNKKLTYFEKMERLDDLEEKHRLDSIRLQNIRPAFLPWIYYRKKPW